MNVADAIAAAVADAAPITFTAPAIVPGRYLLVDGDYAAYFCSGNNETTIGDARTRFMQKLDDMRIAGGCEIVVLHLTATGSHKGWRYVIATETPYQEQRSGSQRPKNWEALRDFMESYKGLAFKPKIWGTREADDGICYHKQVLDMDKAVVAMKDKDSQMFTGCIHLDWNTYELIPVEEGAYEVESSTGTMYGHKWFWIQLLAGDAADHIPGVGQILSHTGKMINCGMARAKDALCMSAGNEDAFDIVVKHYARRHGVTWPDRLVEQMGLLWMRQDKDALVDDFLRVVPNDSAYTQPVTEAAGRLVARVQEAIDNVPNY